MSSSSSQQGHFEWCWVSHIVLLGSRRGVPLLPVLGLPGRVGPGCFRGQRATTSALFLLSFNSHAFGPAVHQLGQPLLPLPPSREELCPHIPLGSAPHSAWAKRPQPWTVPQGCLCSGHAWSLLFSSKSWCQAWDLPGACQPMLCAGTSRQAVHGTSFPGLLQLAGPAAGLLLLRPYDQRGQASSFHLGEALAWVSSDSLSLPYQGSLQGPWIS